MRRTIGGTVRRARELCATSTVLLAVLVSGGTAAPGGEFVLGPGDKVAISVHKRPDLSGEFRVLPDGYLPLPLVSSLQVAGLTLTKARDEVADSFREKAFLLDPRVTIDLVEARPILVAGDVRRPGSVPFQSGMTVLHAVSAAGGRRAMELDSLNARLEVGRLREKLRTSQESTGLMLLRRARLLAERADRPAFDPPADIKSYLTEARMREAQQSEQLFLQQRSEAHRIQLDLLARQKGTFEEEMTALEAQVVTKTRESAIVDEERRYIEALLQRGLTPRTGRNVELQRILVQIEGEKRQLATLIAKAKQEIGRVDQAVATQTNQRQIEITAQLREVEDNLATLRIAIDESQASLIDAREVLPSSGPVGVRTPTSYEIVRNQGEGNIRLTAKADTPLLPGDLVDVP